MAILWAFYKQMVLVTLQRMKVVFILKHILIVGKVIIGLLFFQVSLPIFFICFLQLMGVLEHNLFLCPFMTHFFIILAQTRVFSLCFYFMPSIGVS